jgi:uncharacterized damage-inducible protein DinB
MKRILAIVALAACFPIGMQAQMGAVKGPTPGTKIAPAKSLNALLSMFESQMMGMVKAMPADKYNFAPSQAIFKDEQKTDYRSPNDKGVRTFGQMVGHVAQANYFFASQMSGLKPDVDVKAIATLTDKDQLVAALQASFDFTHKAFDTITPENAFDSVKGEQTRASMAGFIVAHCFDHYGQMGEYLRMNGLIPPASKK